MTEVGIYVGLELIGYKMRVGFNASTFIVHKE